MYYKSYTSLGTSGIYLPSPWYFWSILRPFNYLFLKRSYSCHHCTPTTSIRSCPVAIYVTYTRWFSSNAYCHFPFFKNTKSTDFGQISTGDFFQCPKLPAWAVLRGTFRHFPGGILFILNNQTYFGAACTSLPTVPSCPYHRLWVSFVPRIFIRNTKPTN